MHVRRTKTTSHHALYTLSVSRGSFYISKGNTCAVWQPIFFIHHTDIIYLTAVFLYTTPILFWQLFLGHTLILAKAASYGVLHICNWHLISSSVINLNLNEFISHQNPKLMFCEYGLLPWRAATAPYPEGRLIWMFVSWNFVIPKIRHSEVC